MDSLAEARVKRYLVTRYKRDPHETGAIFFNIRHLARVSGHEVDHRFAHAGMAAGGPEGRVASSIVDRALGGGGGSPTSDYQAKQVIDQWVRTTPPMGM